MIDRRLSGQGVTLLAIGIGGALGALARYGVATAWPAGTVPWSTLVINGAGSLLLGLLLELPVSRLPFGMHGRSLLGTGFCGGFTTFSTLTVELATRSGPQTGAAAIYLVLSLAMIIAVVPAGRLLGTSLVGTEDEV